MIAIEMEKIPELGFQLGQKGKQKDKMNFRFGQQNWGFQVNRFDQISCKFKLVGKCYVPKTTRNALQTTIYHHIFNIEKQINS